MFKSGIATQCSHWSPTWEHLRDNAKPIVPDDVHQLREVREMVPPSKAHIKRLQRQRLLVAKAARVVAVDSDPGGGRARLNEARRYGSAVAEALGHKPYKAHPLPAKPLAPIPPAPKGAVKAEERSYRAERAHMIAMSKMAYSTFEPDEARVIKVFGSTEAWERAKLLGK